MPANNGTGPLGQGPMTGKSMGYCAMKVQEDESDKTMTMTEAEELSTNDRESPPGRGQRRGCRFSNGRSGFPKRGMGRAMAFT